MFSLGFLKIAFLYLFPFTRAPSVNFCSCTLLSIVFQIQTAPLSNGVLRVALPGGRFPARSFSITVLIIDLGFYSVHDSLPDEISIVTLGCRQMYKKHILNGKLFLKYKKKHRQYQRENENNARRRARVGKFCIFFFLRLCVINNFPPCIIVVVVGALCAVSAATATVILSIALHPTKIVWSFVDGLFVI